MTKPSPLREARFHTMSKPHRSVYGLEHAELCQWPRNIPMPKSLSGTKAQGKTFERKVVKGLGAKFGQDLLTDQWFRYQDVNGTGYCQPDAIIIYPHICVVVEAKLTYTETARTQLTDLYLPIVSLVFRKPAIGMIVCKNLVRGMKVKSYPSYAEAMLSNDALPVWQFLGRGPI